MSGPNFNGVFSLALQSDGKILAGGSFTEFDGLPAPGLARLHNDGFEERVQFASANYAATEGQGSAFITVRRIGASRKSVRMHYQAVAGTARPGQDYRPASGQVVFAPGETMKAFAVTLREDNKVEGKETLQLTVARRVSSESSARDTEHRDFDHHRLTRSVKSLAGLGVPADVSSG